MSNNGPNYSYAAQPSQVGPDVNSTVHSAAVYLGDAIDPDRSADIATAGFESDDWANSQRPGYAGNTVVRDLLFRPGTELRYTFDEPRQDIGSIPGTDTLVIFEGPVTGSAMDMYQTGEHTEIGAQVPGYYGPVGATAPDYATVVAYANFAQAFEFYSTDASNSAMVSAV